MEGGKGMEGEKGKNGCREEGGIGNESGERGAKKTIKLEDKGSKRGL